MKFRALLLSVFLFMAAGYVHAQIESEIKSFVDSTEVVVNNGRKLMLQKLSGNDLAGTREIYQYLNKITENQDYKAFEYGEKLYINLLVGDWQNLMSLMKGFQTESNKLKYPNSYPIWALLYEKVKAKQDALEADIEAAALNAEDKDILKMYFHLLKVADADDEYNKMLIAFNKNYPETAYKSFLKDYMPAKRVPGSIVFSFGAGIVNPTGELHDYFQSRACFNMCMDVNIGRVYTSLFLVGTQLNLIKEFDATLNDELVHFKRGDDFSYVNGGLKVGYFLVRNNRFHAAPYVSLTGINLESTLFDDEDKDEFSFVESFACGVGLHTETKLVTLKRPSKENNRLGSHLSLKIDCGYNQRIDRRPDFGGNIWDLNFSLVWGGGVY